MERREGFTHTKTTGGFWEIRGPSGESGKKDPIAGRSPPFSGGEERYLLAVRSYEAWKMGKNHGIMETSRKPHQRLGEKT